MELITQSILPFLIILLGLIVIHEAGHYFTAKLFGVKVLEAGIGLPPRIWGFTWRGTDYTINALPIGAFVRMLGEEDPSDPQSLAAADRWKRVIIIGSGAFMNLVVAVLLFAASLMIPTEVSEGGAVITDVIPGSPAEEAGLQAGDEILEVNGRTAENTTDAAYFIRLAQGSTVDLKIKRDDPFGRTGSEIIDKEVYARWDPGTYVDECGIERPSGPTGIRVGTPHGQYVPVTREERADIEPDTRTAFKEFREDVPPGQPPRCTDGSQFGFFPLTAAECAELTPEEQQAARERKDDLFPGAAAPCYEFNPGTQFVPFLRTRSQPPWEAFPNGMRLAFESLILTRNTVWSLLRGFESTTSAPVAGPVGIAQATGEAVEEAGWISLVTLAGGISMSLALINILPIPMVDGGRLVFIFIEFIRRGRRIDPQKEALVHLAGFAVLIVLFLVITWYDLARWIGGDSLLQ